MAAMAMPKTLSKYQQVRLEKIGATITDDVLLATEDDLWLARIVGKTRVLLEMREQLHLTA